MKLILNRCSEEQKSDIFYLKWHMIRAPKREMYDNTHKESSKYTTIKKLLSSFNSHPQLLYAKMTINSIYLLSLWSTMNNEILMLPWLWFHKLARKKPQQNITSVQSEPDWWRKKKTLLYTMFKWMVKYLLVSPLCIKIKFAYQNVLIKSVRSWDTRNSTSV